jgi:cytochrome c biogenesis protein ResB
MLLDKFPMQSTYTSLENFHHIKQNTYVADYIQRFEEVMSLMQMEYPNLSEPYFVSSFIAGLRDGIQHYLIPHNPQNLSEAY